MGSAALYQLSKRGLEVVGVDQYAPPHTLGSSHGQSRVTRQAIGEDPAYTPMVLRANEIWTELEQLSGEKLYDHCGMLIAAHKEQRFLQNTLKAAEEFAIEHQVFDGAEAERLFPALDVAEKDHSFYYEPTSGYLRPEKCIEVQLKLAQKNGVELRLNTEMTAMREVSGGVELKLSDGETMNVAKVVVASGPWIVEMLPETLRPRLKTLLQTQYWFDIDPAHYEELLPGKMPVFLCGDEKGETTRSFYGFPMMNGSEGGMKFSVHETDKQVGPDDKDTAEPMTSAEEMYKFISRYIRGLKPKALRAVNCLYTVTPDENFILDFVPGSQRIVFASACSGHGFKHSAAVGEALAEMATRGRTTLDISRLTLARFGKDRARN
jgi:monomeric sarcosine oxidase